MTITPGSYDLTIYQGTTFNEVFTWTDVNNVPINITGYTAALMVRSSIVDSVAFITLTTANGGITINGSAGTITLSMLPAATAALTQISGIYDLNLTSPAGVVSRILEGLVFISAGVTR